MFRSKQAAHRRLAANADRSGLPESSEASESEQQPADHSSANPRTTQTLGLSAPPIVSFPMSVASVATNRLEATVSARLKSTKAISCAHCQELRGMSS